MKNTGKIHVYCGNGKGKTTILNGMAIRALGANMRVKYFRFLKNRESSENKILEKLGIKIDSDYKFSSKFVWEMNAEEVEIFKKETRDGFEKFKTTISSNEYDLVLADEILGAVENGFISEEELILALKNKNQETEVAISGRKLFKSLEDSVNLISKIDPVKHYFEEGTKAREGIEY